jgi:putative endopeptidase
VAIALILGTIAGANSSASQAKEDFLAANIDTTASPRDDFFQYANGAWFNRNPIPDTAANWGIGNVLSEEVDIRLRRISEDAAAKMAPVGSDEQLVGDFWFTGMDEATLNKQGLSPLQPDFDSIARVRSTQDLLDVVAVFHRRQRPGPFSLLFSGRVEQDEKDSQRWMYSLRQGGLSRNSPSDYLAANPRAVAVRDALRAYLVKTFLRLHGNLDSATASADGVLKLETELAKAFGEDAYDNVSVDELTRLAPTINWKRYLQRIGVPDNTVNMRSPQFFRTLDALLRTEPLESWKDYLRFGLIRTNAGSLDDVTLENHFAFDRVSTGALSPRPRWRRVLGEMRNFWVVHPLARLYAREYRSAGVEARYRVVAESLRAAFRDRIAHLDWMTDGTKQEALRKLARLKFTIGLPVTTIDFSTMPIRRDSYVLNVMRASEWFRDLEVKKLSGPVDTPAGDLQPSWNDAFYDDSKNEVTVSGASLKIPPGWRVEELDDAFLYSATALGHELAHGFDSGGRHYDANGNKRDWWTPADSAEFVRRSQFLVDQYNGFMPLDGLYVDGARSLRENMADLAGVRIALDAFKRTEQFKKGERVAGFTPLQRFFLAYAYSHMFQSRPAAIASQLRAGAYAPNRERVNGVLMNIPEFYEAFDIKPGDRMYLPEEKRTSIW